MEGSIMCFVLLCLLVVNTAWSKDSEEEVSLEDTVRTLKGQVSALLERRQEDYRILENSLRRSLEKNFELSTLRTELDQLRREVDELRGTKVGNQQKNDHLTVQWLSTAVSELRQEVTEVAAAHNASAELQQRQETTSEIGLLRGDVASFRRDFEEMQTDQERNDAKISQIQQEMTTTRVQSQNTAALCSDLKSELQSARTEWTLALKTLKKATTHRKHSKHSLLSNDVVREPRNIMAEPEEKKYRHNHDLRVKVNELGSSEKELHTTQSLLEHKIRRVEKQLKTLLYHGGGRHSGEELQVRVGRLEAASQVAVKAMFNATRQLASMDKIHQSMLELLESVENLENKVDKNVPDLQREISKMEFNMAQTTSSVALIKENQDNQGAMLKAISSGMVGLQAKLDTNRGHIILLQAQILNLTAEDGNNLPNDAIVNEMQLAVKDQITGSETPTKRSGSHKNQSNAVQQLVQELNQVQQEYKGIIERLPHECSVVSGASGLYLIAPGGVGGPLMTHCDQDSGAGGWTTIQRRVDGKQEFNRKWDEYAKGFGSPSGEFWLGNEGIHRLTSDNCSSLRVDLTDIYGKSWVAEYTEFSVAAADDGYRLHVTGYRGNASDALDYQNRMQFSTIDSDRDISNTHCASNYEGGWWFSHCQHANLNGRYTLGLTWFDGIKNEWIAVATSEMKVRRREGCEKKKTTTTTTHKT